jgi:hypothetical protein
MKLLLASSGIRTPARRSCPTAARVVRALHLIAVAATLLGPVSARADWGFDFVRLACIPESGYLQLEYKVVSGRDVLTDAQLDDTKTAERLRAWERHGFLDPHHLKRTCRLAEATYVIETAQAPPAASGTCGGAPRIALDVTHNGERLFTDVPLGPNCIRGPGVANVEVSEPPAGWGGRTMTVCVFNDAEQTRCKYLADDEALGAGPITEDRVRGFANER